MRKHEPMTLMIDYNTEFDFKIYAFCSECNKTLDIKNIKIDNDKIYLTIFPHNCIE